MSIGGFFSNWGNWDADPDRNAALNQAVTLFGANMLAGAGSGRNLASIVGRSVGAGVEGFNDAQDRTAKRRYMDAQIADQQSQSDFRKAQVAEMQRKAQQAAQLMQLRHAVLNPSPTDAALRTQAQVGGAGPTRQAAQLASGYAENGYRPTPDDLRTLASFGALEPTDVSMFNAYKPEAYKQGDTLMFPGGRRETLPRLPEGAVQAPDGRVYPMAGMPETTFALTGAAEEAKQGVQTRHAFPQAAARAGGEAAFRPPFTVYNAVTGANEGVSPFTYGMEQLGGGLPGVPPMRGAPGPAPGVAPGAAPTVTPTRPPNVQLTPSRADVRATDNTKASDTDWHKGKLETISAGSLAKQQLGQYRGLRTVLGASGWGSESIGAAANALVGMNRLLGRNMDGSTAASFARDVQTFRAAANRLVADYQLAQKGPQTESDAKRYEAMMVRLGNTPEANQLLLDMMEAVATHAAMKGDFYRESDILIRSRRATPEDIDTRWESMNVRPWELPIMQRWRSLEQSVNTAPIPR